MAKSSGLGDNLYVAGVDLSGDVGAIGSITDSQALLEVTGIDKSAVERIVGIADGSLSFTAYFNDDTAAAHATLKARGTTEKIVSYFRGTTLGNAAASLVGLQVDYAPSRTADGAIAIEVPVQGSDGDGLRWGRMLTDGKRTDVAATNGTSIDDGAASSFGLIAYLHVFDFTGTDVTVALEDSANNSTWAAISGGAFTQVTAAPASERIRTATNGTVRRYVRAVTSGTFDSVTFAVAFHRRDAAN